MHKPTNCDLVRGIAIFWTEPSKYTAENSGLIHSKSYKNSRKNEKQEKQDQI